MPHKLTGPPLLQPYLKELFHNDKFLDHAVLVDQFIKLNWDWFHNETNALYGMERAARLHLRAWVETGEYPDIPVGTTTSYKLIYIENQFDEFVKDIIKNEQSV